MVSTMGLPTSKIAYAVIGIARQHKWGSVLPTLEIRPLMVAYWTPVTGWALVPPSGSLE